jgi:hypothetical protein
LDHFGSEENGETCDEYVEYGLPPPRRIQQRRDWKWLKNKSIPWQRRRRLLQVVTGTFPCGQQLVKYGYNEKAECILCKKEHEESGGSWKGELSKETIGHIQSDGCLGQKEVVTAEHNACIRELLQEKLIQIV